MYCNKVVVSCNSRPSTSLTSLLQFRISYEGIVYPRKTAKNICKCIRGVELTLKYFQDFLLTEILWGSVKDKQVK